MAVEQRTITDEQYTATQLLIQSIAGLLHNWDALDLFIERLERACAIGPVLHPSEFRAAGDKPLLVLTHARALRQARDKIRETL